MKPLARFRVYPASRRSLYYTVFVWRTLKDFRAANPGNSHALGLCRCYDRIRVYRKSDRKKNRKLPDLGQIHFCKYHLRMGIISHEMLHGAIGWAARTGNVPEFGKCSGVFMVHGSHSPEENFCHALGNMVSQCVQKLFELKLVE